MAEPTTCFKILRTNTVAEMLGISRATLWRWARRGLLPPRRIVGPNTVGWVESEILAWLEARPLRLPSQEEIDKPSATRSEPSGEVR
ncbi:MAG: AlpA family phage regulatory protein [Thermoanaerobaculia bacterium]|nr:AlpA family phage regulatory protein [Thermoanaerobaculia bacterium]